jgi:hypothetical protein
VRRQSRGRVLTKLASLFERAAHAQNSCTQTKCSGSYMTTVSQPCGVSCSDYVYTKEDDNNPTGDSQIDGSVGCAGPTGCPNGPCNSPGCPSGPNCVLVGGQCGTDSDCCTPLTCVDANCVGGAGGGGCQGPGGSCNIDSDCCSGGCAGGTCNNNVEAKRK